MKIVNYPDIKNASAIKGWVSIRKTIVNLEPNSTIKLEDNDAADLKKTYGFLKIMDKEIFEKVEKDIKKEEVVMLEKKIIRQPKIKKIIIKRKK